MSKKNWLRVMVSMLLVVCLGAAAGCSGNQDPVKTKSDLAVEILGVEDGKISLVYNGAVRSVSAMSVPEKQLTIKYSGKAPTVYAESVTAPKDAGQYAAVISYAGDEDYNAYSQTVELNITKAAGRLQIDCPSVPVGTEVVVSVIENLGGGAISYTYAGRDGTVYQESGEAPDTIGKYTVKAVAAESKNHFSAQANADFEILRSPGSVPVNAPVITAKSFDTIAVAVEAGLEYRVSGGGYVSPWSSTGVFEELEGGTAYSVVSRTAATDSNSASSAGPAEAVTTYYDALINDFESESPFGHLSLSDEHAFSGTYSAALSGTDNYFGDGFCSRMVAGGYNAGKDWTGDISGSIGITVMVYASSSTLQTAKFRIVLANSSGTEIKQHAAADIETNKWVRYTLMFEELGVSGDVLKGVLKTMYNYWFSSSLQELYIDDFSLIADIEKTLASPSAEDANMVENFGEEISVTNIDTEPAAIALSGVGSNSKVMLAVRTSAQSSLNFMFSTDQDPANAVFTYEAVIVSAGFMVCTFDLGSKTPLIEGQIAYLVITKNAPAQLNVYLDWIVTAKAEVVFTVPGISAAKVVDIQQGEALPVVSISPSGKAFSIEYKLKGADDSTYTSTSPSTDEEGSYTVRLSFAGDSEYKPAVYIFDVNIVAQVNTHAPIAMPEGAVKVTDFSDGKLMVAPWDSHGGLSGNPTGYGSISDGVLTFDNFNGDWLDIVGDVNWFDNIILASSDSAKASTAHIGNIESFTDLNFAIRVEGSGSVTIRLCYYNPFDNRVDGGNSVFNFQKDDSWTNCAVDISKGFSIYGDNKGVAYILIQGDAGISAIYLDWIAVS